MSGLGKYCFVLSLFFGANLGQALISDAVPGDELPGDEVPGDEVLGDEVPGNEAPGYRSLAPAVVLDYADQVLECGVYYKYTAGGMSHNPNIAPELVDDVSDNAKTLLQSADWLYGAAGVSAEARYQAVMARARRLVGESQAHGGAMSELIFAFGRKCQRLVADYPARMREFVEKLASP